MSPWKISFVASSVLMLCSGFTISQILLILRLTTRNPYALLFVWVTSQYTAPLLEALLAIGLCDHIRIDRRQLSSAIADFVYIENLIWCPKGANNRIQTQKGQYFNHGKFTMLMFKVPSQFTWDDKALTHSSSEKVLQPRTSSSAQLGCHSRLCASKLADKL